MTSAIHVFTSITSNYLPKARVLAASLKREAPQAVFHLMLSDEPPAGFDLQNEPFDHLITLDDLPIENRTVWLFSHTVVELCTAVKGLALNYLFEQYNADKVFFFDPDMVVFGRFDELLAELDQHSLLLTPHQTEPEQTEEAIIDNEMCSLLHGVFNLGFVGVKNDDNGRRFAAWWRDRLLSFCHDDLRRGLFTDQKWVNLAPCFFDRVRVLRSPAFNVATWNITQRTASGNLKDGVKINGEPLGFYHFSGFDSGAQEAMLGKYGKNNPTLHELRDWYIDACDEQGQQTLGKVTAKYGLYDDGSAITKEERELYRIRPDLHKAFPDPFAVTGLGYKCYKEWYRVNVPVAAKEKRIVAIPTDAPLCHVSADIQDWLQRKSRSGSTRLRRLIFRVGAWLVGFAVKPL